MVHGYLNYPRSRVQGHRNPNCGNIQSQRKTNQRVIPINPVNLAAEINNFAAGNHRFEAKGGPLNDMWVVIDLGNVNAELQALSNIHQALAQIYKPFANAQLNICC